MSEKTPEEIKGKIKYFDASRKLKQTEIDFMKLIEQQNLERVNKLKKTRKNNIVTGKNEWDFRLFSCDIIANLVFQDFY